MTEREQFIIWLNDARSTELAMIPVLKNHANDARDYPEIYERDMQHLAETERQAERLETMIKSLGGSVSTVKTLTGKVLGLGKSVSTEFFRDELIKNFLADFAAENFEIASYRSLIATAELIGEEQCVPILTESLNEEIAMANWIEQYIPIATAESLKIIASEDYDKSSGYASRRSKKKTGLARLTSSKTLVTLLTLGAIGTGAAMLLSSRNKNAGFKNDGNKNDGINNSLGDNIEQSDVVVTETLIIVEEPELRASQASGGQNF